MKEKQKRYVDLSGRRFGKLTVNKYLYTNKQRQAVWECKCDCGNTKNTIASSLLSGACLSCGCLRLERLKESKCNYKHGDSNSHLYILWMNMKARCYNTNSKDYTRYGERGITVCQQWINSFETFKVWALNNGYDESLTIDRIDNNGNYEPQNCRFVSRKEQANNTRSNVSYQYNGESHTLSEWAEIFNIKKGTL